MPIVKLKGFFAIRNGSYITWGDFITIVYVQGADKELHP